MSDFLKLYSFSRYKAQGMKWEITIVKIDFFFVHLLTF